jgi:TPR repeat protein
MICRVFNINYSPQNASEQGVPFWIIVMPHFLSRINLAVIFSAISFAAMAGNVEDDLRTAAKLHKGGETPKAVSIWKDWAGQGNADAAYNLAVIHQYGDGVALDYDKAMQWYRVAADKGDKISQFQIGLMYQTGQGVTVNEEEAHRWFTLHHKHHMHHLHTPQMAAWRERARAMIVERDQREYVAASRKNSAQILADLKQRAGMGYPEPVSTASLNSGTVIR